MLKALPIQQVLDAYLLYLDSQDVVFEVAACEAEISGNLDTARLLREEQRRSRRLRKEALALGAKEEVQAPKLVDVGGWTKLGIPL